MSLIPFEKKLTIEIFDDLNEILKYLYTGTNIPIWPEFHKYIIRDLKTFNAKSIILFESGNPAGNVLIYHDNFEDLYFGYFRVINHEINKIDKLIDELIKYGKKNNFKSITGPINIPGIIFGWGFMEESRVTNLFPISPVNPPIYKKLFIKKGFIINNRQNFWEGYLPRINPWKVKKYNFSDYEYFYPKNFDELMKLKPIFLKIQLENLPKSAQIAPRNPNLFDNYAEYIFEFGYNFMIFFVRYKPSNEIVACGSFIPNPFRRDKKGNYDSCITLTMAIKPEHRRKGLGILMYGATSLEMWKNKIRYGGGPAASNNKEITKFAQNVGGIIGRTYVILKYILKKS